MKRWGIVAVVVGIVVVVAAIIFFGLGFYLSPQSPLRKADAIVAVSGGDTTARTDAAVGLWQDHWAPWLIFSGAAADPDSPSNAAQMAALAEASGVPARDILLDPSANNTEANGAGVAKIAAAHHFTSIILVTSPYHQRRASIVFHRSLGRGVTIINHSSIDLNWRRSHWWATPYSRDLTLSELQKTVYELVVK